ncbi:SDR family NAD(P)-dependent oxidoreductase [Algoriphagus sediminis]|uniref:SDR family NAD(P)-dependent oxidoreductase n=1 Tax=Algoriphagus sediminis TaxID=3057113 RepID=A0ABT7YEJ0_9BACT|nr:SDR family NAD(P)-dependent oxidoreductase [Algoriphagus sediminis]MDN3204614.1 SDR family NAD(P)-dependent oxidoreductase [Algoriphagus sediminis]
MKILLTGSTSGIGWETFKDLWSEGHEMILPVRNVKKAEGMLHNFGVKERIYVYPMDLANLNSVSEAAGMIIKDHDQIEVIINNAGGMYPQQKKSDDGIDLTFSVNHLGHFLLTTQVLKKLKKSPSKVINVSSEAHKIAKVRKDDLGLIKSTSDLTSYANVKLYNILFTIRLKQKYGEKGLNVFSLHPGAVRTNFGSDSGPISKAIIQLSQLFFISAKKGAQTTLHLVKQDNSKLVNGAYYKKQKPANSSKTAKDMELAKALWDYSEGEIERILG